MKFLKIIKIILFNILILFLGIIILEIIFGKWFAKNNYGNLLIPRYSIAIIDDPPYQSERNYIYTRDKNGFRANNYNLDEIDILIIGGSTTEERDIDDNLIWTKVFERKVSKKQNIKVLNAGIGGQTSYGHGAMFDLWYGRFQELKPKYILIYIGINDALHLVEGLDSGKLIIKNERFLNNTSRDRLVSIYRVDQLIQYINNNSAIHLLYWIIRSNYISNKHNVKYGKDSDKLNTSNQKTKNNNISVKKPQINNKYLLEFMNQYENNLINIINYSKAKSAEPIFITQNIADYHDLYPYLQLVNQQTIRTCKEKKIICFRLHEKIKFFKEIDWYDNIHTTPSGSEKIGELIAEFFVKQKLILD